MTPRRVEWTKCWDRKHTFYRPITARDNDVVADRPDMQFASKELRRWMAAPTESGLLGLKRLGRYFEGHRRLVYEYPFSVRTALWFTAILIAQDALTPENPRVAGA